MEHYEKVYVETLARFTTDGKLLPVSIFWEDGAEYAVDRVLSEENAPPRYVGAYLTRRYRVRVEGREKELYFEPETSKWFVEKRVFPSRSAD